MKNRDKIKLLKKARSLIDQAFVDGVTLTWRGDNMEEMSVCTAIGAQQIQFFHGVAYIMIQGREHKLKKGESIEMIPGRRLL